MTVRAKFKCTYKDPGEEGNITLEAVIDGSEENKSFFHYTPSGMVRLGIVNPAAFSQFEPGKEYYLDFTKAE